MVLRETWKSKLQHTKRQVLDAIFKRVLSFRKKQETNPKVVELPDDIVKEILHRLPLKDLLRWRSVSKGWKSMIESGDLAEKHTRLRQIKYGSEEMKISVHQKKKKSGDLYVKYYKPRDKIYNKDKDSVLLVGGSCDGLVCVYDLVNVYLYNPVTRVMRTLTLHLHTIDEEVTHPCMKLSVGFGRDVVTGKYKVVVLYNNNNNSNTQVDAMVFDLSESKWRRSRYKTAGPMLPLSFRYPVFVNGSLFWLLTSLHHSEMLAMDLHTEKFRTVFVSEGWRRRSLSDPPLEWNCSWLSPSLVSPYNLS